MILFLLQLKFLVSVDLLFSLAFCDVIKCKFRCLTIHHASKFSLLSFGVLSKRVRFQTPNLEKQKASKLPKMIIILKYAYRLLPFCFWSLKVPFLTFVVFGCFGLNRESQEVASSFLSNIKLLTNCGCTHPFMKEDIQNFLITFICKTKKLWE